MKKNWSVRLLSGALALCLLTGTASAASVQSKHDLTLANSVTLTGAALDLDGKTVREQVLTYTPGGDVQPVVAYGQTLYGRSTMDYIERYLEEQDLAVTAAINAAFFDMSTGVPYGMVVSDGILRTGGNVNTVGILKDGSMMIGQPDLTIKLAWEGGEADLSYNKALSRSNGYCLYSRDYDNKTKHSLSAYNLILSAEEGQLKTNSTITASVTAIEADTKDCAIPENGFVLALAMETDYSSAMEQVKAFQVGQKFTITVSVEEPWENVAYAVGGGDLLVENGRAKSSFDLDSAKRAAARTALGIKGNGEVVCYTADKGTLSEGLTLSQLADRMEELGCETAINLDGGGSTTLGATLPGMDAFETLNDPADGAQRPCANFLFFTRPKRAAGPAVRLHVYPYDAAVLLGGQVELAVAASDANYMAAQVPAGISLTSSGGAISQNVFTATKTGSVSVTAYGGGLTGSVNIHVVETPTEMTVRRQNQDVALEKLIVEGGETVDLTVDAQYLGLPLSAKDYAFSWYVPAELGRIGEDGLFTASENKTEGQLMVTCGELRVTIPVEIRPNPFADTKGHWAKSYITELYYADVLQGSANAEGVMNYRPDDSMTRQEFVAAMMRSTDVNLKDHEAVELPFADTQSIAPWAMGAMRAAYDLGWFTGSGRGEELYADPNATITREAAMTILARTIGAYSESDALEAFSDGDKVSDWAQKALTAMVEREIINGMDGKLLPQGSVTRAQVAKMLYAMG